MKKRIALVVLAVLATALLLTACGEDGTTAGVATTTGTESTVQTCDHAQTEVKNAVAATCTAAGYTGDTYCTVCGEKTAEGEEIAALGHGETEIKDAVAATCTAAGYTGDTYCTVCNEKIADGEEIAALGHGETEVKDAVAATCTEAGYTGDTYCTVCNEKIAEGEEIAALGHGETEVKDAVAATCTTAGYTGDTYCTVCGEKTAEGEEIAALGHGETEVKDAVAATCTAAGYTGDTYCTVCGEKLTAGEAIAALGHSFGQWTVTKEATTAAAGEQTRACTNAGCTETQTQVIPQLSNNEPNGHSWDAGTVTKAATCTEKGTMLYHCTNDGCEATKEEEIAALGHGTTELRNAKAATCTEAGYTGDTYCTVCGEKLAEGKVIDALGHGEAEVKDAVVATCTEAGYTGDTYCTVCGEKTADGKVIDASGHQWNEGEVTKAATCTEAGTKQYKCTNDGCTASEAKAIEALGHKMTQHNAVSGTCTTEGTVAYYSCANCNKNFADENGKTELTSLTTGKDADNHSGSVATAWTTDSTSHWHAYSCCGVKVDEAAHSFGQWTVTVDVTYEAPGQMSSACACGYESTQEISQYGIYTAYSEYAKLDIKLTINPDGTITLVDELAGRSATNTAAMAGKVYDPLYNKVDGFTFEYYEGGTTSTASAYFEDGVLHVDFNGSYIPTLKTTEELTFDESRVGTYSGTHPTYGMSYTITIYSDGTADFTGAGLDNYGNATAPVAQEKVGLTALTAGYALIYNTNFPTLVTFQFNADGTIELIEQETPTTLTKQ